MTVHATIAVPSAPPRRLVGWWVVPFILLAAGIAAGVKLYPWNKSAAADVPLGQFYTVVPTDLEIKIVKDGELQAVRYIDVDNKVDGSTQIIWLAKEGATVEKGEELVKLDPSALKEKKDIVDLDLQKAQSNVKIAEEMKVIQEMQNAANKEAAEVAVQLAKLATKQYVEGNYPQQLENARTAREMADINLKNKIEDLEQTKTLFRKGFVTASDVKKAELDVTNQRNELKKAETALLVLEQYSRPMDLARLRSDEAQAEQKLARTLRENRSRLTQAEADLSEKQASLRLISERNRKLQDQIDACTITAPEAGLVIYMSSIDRSMREPIQEGTMVRQNQTLMRLPDVRNMKAVLKIQEAQKPKLDITHNLRAIVKILGVGRPIGATLSRVAVLPDNTQRWWNPDLKEYPVELTLDETPAGLKPGTRVDAEIFVDRFDGALAVPLAAIYTAGRQSYVFVRDGDTVRERKITIGASNETHVQVTSGLKEGEQVMLLQAGQGRLLLEKAGIKVDQPTSKPSRGKRQRGGVAEAPAPAKS